MTLCLWAAASCAGNPTVEVEEAWVAEGPPTATALAGYLTLHNRGDNTVVLKGVGSPLFASAALHRTVITQGVASMVAQPSVELGGGASLRFMPGDYHIMLMHPSQNP